MEKIKDTMSIFRAKITISEEEGYDFSCIGVPYENSQIRYSFSNNEYFYQVLMTGDENIIKNRLDLGLGLFDNHPSDLSARNILGKSVGYEFVKDGLKLNILLGARADEALRSDISNNILSSVSIEGEVHEYKIERKDGEIPIYKATLWEPTSISIAPVPNDVGAKIDVNRALAQLHNKPFLTNLINKFK